MKLKHVGETYTAHLLNAIKFASISFLASLVMTIHAIFPFLFQKTGMRLLLSIIYKNSYRRFGDNSHIQIRYNTKNNGGPLKWRVLVDGEELLASHVEVYGYLYGESSIIDNTEKMNIACDGTIYWSGTAAKIVTSKIGSL